MQVDLAALVGAIGDALVVTDAQGLIRLWNPGAQRLFGYTPEEALGHSMDLIIPERLRHRHWEGCRKTMDTGITRYGSDVLKVPAIGKDGRQLSIAFTVALLNGADGKPWAVAAVIRDDTQRFQEDRALRKRVAELEARLAGLPEKPPA